MLLECPPQRFHSHHVPQSLAVPFFHQLSLDRASASCTLLEKRDVLIPNQWFQLEETLEQNITTRQRQVDVKLMKNVWVAHVRTP